MVTLRSVIVVSVGSLLRSGRWPVLFVITVVIVVIVTIVVMPVEVVRISPLLGSRTSSSTIYADFIQKFLLIIDGVIHKVIHVVLGHVADRSQLSKKTLLLFL